MDAGEAVGICSRGELEAAAATLCDAFVEDPIFAYFLRADARRDAARRRFFRVVLQEAAYPDGEVARTAGCEAAAVWMPSERLASTPASRELRALPMLLNATGIGRFGRLVRLRKAMDAKHPMERAHDYLWFLGVRPDRQGRGLGSKLLQARTEALDARGRPAFLETATERNLALYHRHGFEIVDSYRPEESGPLIWAMWREPRLS